jgi:hypothetical protein
MKAAMQAIALTGQFIDMQRDRQKLICWKLVLHAAYNPGTHSNEAGELAHYPRSECPNNYDDCFSFKKFHVQEF